MLILTVKSAQNNHAMDIVLNSLNTPPHPPKWIMSPVFWNLCSHLNETRGACIGHHGACRETSDSSKFTQQTCTSVTCKGRLLCMHISSAPPPPLHPCLPSLQSQEAQVAREVLGVPSIHGYHPDRSFLWALSSPAPQGDQVDPLDPLDPCHL